VVEPKNSPIFIILIIANGHAVDSTFIFINFQCPPLAISLMLVYFKVIILI